MHFFESSIITTKDGLHCQVYSNEHPSEAILVKPKYIPTEKVESTLLPYRFIASRKMNRLSLWIEKEGLQQYFNNFKAEYPQYIYHSPQHDQRFFFAIPIDSIERIYFPRRGLKELMSMPLSGLDPHLKSCCEFIQLLLQSGVGIENVGITYSTLMGHYFSTVSDINIVIYGKENFWKIIKYLETAQHPLLRWKTPAEWEKFLQHRDRSRRLGDVEVLQRKKSEGYFGNTLFVLFGVENEEEVWSKWGQETYKTIGVGAVTGIVKNNYSSIVRPGCYEIEQTSGPASKVTKIVFYNRDYCLLAYPGETVEACGVLEEVTPLHGEKYHRLVIGYFDAYISNRREQEYMRVTKMNVVK